MLPVPFEEIVDFLTKERRLLRHHHRRVQPGWRPGQRQEHRPAVAQRRDVGLHAVDGAVAGGGGDVPVDAE